MINQSEYIARRNNFLEKVDENSISILFSGKGKKVSGDEFSYQVNKNFYYLTGIEQENSVLVLVKTDGETFSYLFIDEKDEKVEKWTGYKLTIDEAKTISGIDNVCLRSTFDGKLLTLLGQENKQFENVNKVYIDLEPELKIADLTSTKQFELEIKKQYKLPVDDLHDIVMNMRMVKSPAEIEMIKEAIGTTNLALSHVLLNMKVGDYEYNLKNVFEFSVAQDSNSKLAFNSIVASGKNAIVLHYPDAKDKLNDNELVLLDVGAANKFYCSDISRTYPINGKFTETQKLIYSIVLECNKQTAKFMRPGITLKEANDFAKNFLANECFEKGLINSKEEISNVYYHSVSHHLGLDTHDGTDRTSKLVPGNVVTDEPGLYFKDLGIGIRIEDDILITEDGSEVLSFNVIKEIDDIEKALRNK